MSVSVLSLTRALGSVSGLLQVVSLLSLVLLLLKAVQFYLRRQWLLKVFHQFPSPPSHWLCGHSLKVGWKLLKRVKKFPCAYPRWMWGDKVHLVVYDPDYMKVVLRRSGTGLLLLEGQTWFQHRRMLTPAFHYDILKPYLSLMADSVRGMLVSSSLVTCTCSHPAQLAKSTFRYFLGHHLIRTCQSYIQAVRNLNDMFFSRVRNVFYQYDFIYRLTPEGRRNHQTCQLAHQHTDAVIKERKAHLKKEGELEKVRSRRHLDFLDILLFARMENGSSLSNEDLRAEVDTFMFGGHDTTASSISWILYALASHPEHQQRCREEIQSLLGDARENPWGDLDQMPYTTMCIKEAMRLYPPVPIISRNLCKPITFPDGRSLPAGMNFTSPLISLSFYGLHHNPKVWPNPELRTGFETTSHFIFLPGPRNCIGKQFAMNEMKVAVALTLLRFELSPDPSRVPCLTPEIVLKSKNGIHLQLRTYSS
uniref:Uncharacterized protein n=1 Tax=Moschus moschiferus TaxID=68415 RepID=A0A8C6DZC2_MOSMO